MSKPIYIITSKMKRSDGSSRRLVTAHLDQTDDITTVTEVYETVVPSMTERRQVDTIHKQLRRAITTKCKRIDSLRVTNLDGAEYIIAAFKRADRIARGFVHATLDASLEVTKATPEQVLLVQKTYAQWLQHVNLNITTQPLDIKGLRAQSVGWLKVADWDVDRLSTLCAITYNWKEMPYDLITERIHKVTLRGVS